MSKLKARLQIELELIARSLDQLPPSRSCSGLSVIELAGVAALLNSFYNGIEKILKDILKFKNLALPDGANWHRDLVNLAVQQQIITGETVLMLSMYVAFRHFFVHAYVIDLDAERLEVLVQQVDVVFEQVKQDLAQFL